MSQIIPYVNFNGNCREAMNFYKECLGGELTMQTVGETPMASQMPAEAKDSIMHASLMKDGLSLMASDMIGANFQKGNNVMLCINCSTKEEIETYFEKLSEGGKIHHPLKEEFWGSTFGDLTDKFGMKWMMNFDKPKA